MTLDRLEYRFRKTKAYFSFYDPDLRECGSLETHTNKEKELQEKLEQAKADLAAAKAEVSSISAVLCLDRPSWSSIWMKDQFS